MKIVTGDSMVVDAPSDYHMGYVSPQGELAAEQIEKRMLIRGAFDQSTDIESIKEIEKYECICSKEESSMYRSCNGLVSLS